MMQKMQKHRLFVYWQQSENKVSYLESDLVTLVSGNALSQGAGESTDEH